MQNAWLPILFMVVAVVAGVAWIADGSADVELTGSCAVPGTDLTLTSGQAASAATIAAVGRTRGLPDRAVVIALATALQESGLRNLDYGDRDSLGLFQQRPSQGWGTEEQVQDPVYAAGKFYDGLVRVPGWETGRLTEVSQSVQRSGYPEAYQKHEAMAQELTAALTAAESGRLTCAFDAPDTGGRPSERTADVASAVERELDVSATEEFGAVSVDPAVGWPGATWAVAHAERLSLAEIRLADRRWTPGSGWEAADDEPAPALVLTLAG